MPKRRRGAVDDSDESDFEDSSYEGTNEVKEEEDFANETEEETALQANNNTNFRDRRNRLRGLTESRGIKEESDEPSKPEETGTDDSGAMKWPVVLRTASKSKQNASTNTNEDDEYHESESSSDSESEESEDAEFEYSDGGFVVDSDDNVVPAHRRTQRSGRRGPGRPPGRPRGRPPGRPRGRPSGRRRRQQNWSDDDEETSVRDSDDEFTASEGSIAEELRELRGSSPQARRNRNYRARAPVDYSIPPPPTVEEVARAEAKKLTAKTSETQARRLFDVRGPFGGKDVHTLFTISREELETLVKSLPSNEKAIKAAAGSGIGIGSGIGGIGGASGSERDSQGRTADIDPIDITEDVDFSMVGGLDDYISKLKEMISLPLLYPEVYEKFGITPPRGVLFHGPPGTGKTLMARALASSHRQEKVTFYMRKGADVLSKWIGESERQLKALFEEARKNQPSIIFFDEIDGLAPVRSAKQEQHHASIVSTLLALMDGMDNRGQVVVIGATNRPDSVDPALRRPGRFDREFYFPLPDYEARRRILQIHTRKWKPPLPEDFVSSIARQTKGFGGADLRALTTEAALLAIQRVYPQIYSSSEKLLVNTDNIEIRPQDFALALERIQPSAARAAGVSLSQPLPSRVEPLLRAVFANIKSKVHAVFPIESRESKLAPLFLSTAQFDQAQAVKQVAQGRVHRPRLLIRSTPGNGQGYLMRAMANLLEGVYVRELSTSTIFGASMGATQPESAIVNAIAEARQRAPSCILLPNLDDWAMSPQLELLLSGLLRSLSPTEQVFVVASDESGGSEDETPGDAVVSSSLQAFFGSELVDVSLDTSESNLREFFQPVLEFVKRSPEECLEAQEMPISLPPQLPKVVKEAKEEKEGESVNETTDSKAPTSSGGIFSETERSELRIRSQLKLKLGVILDGFRQRYRRFRKPVIDEQKLVYLFETPSPPVVHERKPTTQNGHQGEPVETEVAQPNGSPQAATTTADAADVGDPEAGDPGVAENIIDDVEMKETEIEAEPIVDDLPYVLTDDNMILERSTGKKYFNMDLETVEDRLWNGFYCEPQQFLEDMEMIYRDAQESGERERMHKASEMLANAQVAIDDISTDKLFIAACKELRAKDARARLQELTPRAEQAEGQPSEAPAGETPKESVNGVANGGAPNTVEDTRMEDVQNVEVDYVAAQQSMGIHEYPKLPSNISNPTEQPPSVSEIVVKPHPPSAVSLDQAEFHAFHQKLISFAQNMALEQLEQLYAALSETVWQYRKDWDRTAMVKAMDLQLEKMAHR